MSKLKLRRDSAANWASIDPILAAGEPGLDLTNLVLKLGDGVTHWSALTGLDVRGDYATKPTGAPNGSKFYRDDGTWAVPAGGQTQSGAVASSGATGDWSFA